MLSCGIGAEGLNSGRIVSRGRSAVKSSSAGDFSREIQTFAKGEIANAINHEIDESNEKEWETDV